MLSYYQIANEIARQARTNRKRQEKYKLIYEPLQKLPVDRTEGKWIEGIYLEAGELEILDNYSAELLNLGIDVFELEVLEVIVAHASNIQQACEVTLQYGIVKHFTDESHAQLFFKKALRKGWKPFK